MQRVTKRYNRYNCDKCDNPDWLVHTHETNSGMGAVSRKSPFLCTSARSDTTDTNDTNLIG